MHKIAWAVALAILGPSLTNACFAQHMNAKDGPCQGPSSTAQGYDCFYSASRKSDAKLNTLYRRIQSVIDGGELTKLKEFQRLSIQFRDANCDAEYELYGGGSA